MLWLGTRWIAEGWNWRPANNNNNVSGSTSIVGIRIEKLSNKPSPKPLRATWNAIHNLFYFWKLTYLTINKKKKCRPGHDFISQELTELRKVAVIYQDGVLVQIKSNSIKIINKIKNNNIIIKLNECLTIWLNKKDFVFNLLFFAE